MDILKTIETRASTKKYVDRMPSEEDIDTVIKAGLRAASGRNMQAPIIVAITNKEIRDEMAKDNAAIFNMPSDPFYNAPVVLLVRARKEAHTYVYDGSLTLGNMMLAAHAQGLGSCWIHREREMFATAEGQALMKQWGLPEGLVGIGALALGYPAGEPSPAKPRKEGYTRVIR